MSNHRHYYPIIQGKTDGGQDVAVYYSPADHWIKVEIAGEVFFSGPVTGDALIGPGYSRLAWSAKKTQLTAAELDTMGWAITAWQQAVKRIKEELVKEGIRL